VRTLVLRASLSGRGIQVITTTNWPAGAANPTRCSWASASSGGPVHSQRLYELAKIDYREFTVSLAC
jgi:conjugal transfer pilus assembly protein TraD